MRRRLFVEGKRMWAGYSVRSNSQESYGKIRANPWKRPWKITCEIILSSLKFYGFVNKLCYWKHWAFSFCCVYSLQLWYNLFERWRKFCYFFASGKKWMFLDHWIAENATTFAYRKVCVLNVELIVLHRFSTESFTFLLCCNRVLITFNISWLPQK